MKMSYRAQTCTSNLLEVILHTWHVYMIEKELLSGHEPLAYGTGPVTCLYVVTVEGLLCTYAYFYEFLDDLCQCSWHEVGQ